MLGIFSVLLPVALEIKAHYVSLHRIVLCWCRNGPCFLIPDKPIFNHTVILLSNHIWWLLAPNPYLSFEASMLRFFFIYANQHHETNLATVRAHKSQIIILLENSPKSQIFEPHIIKRTRARRRRYTEIIIIKEKKERNAKTTHSASTSGDASAQIALCIIRGDRSCAVKCRTGTSLPLDPWTKCCGQGRTATLTERNGSPTTVRLHRRRLNHPNSSAFHKAIAGSVHSYGMASPFRPPKAGGSMRRCCHKSRATVLRVCGQRTEKMHAICFGYMPSCTAWASQTWV